MTIALIIIAFLAVTAYIYMYCSLAFTPGKYLYMPHKESMSRLTMRASLCNFSAWQNDSEKLIGWKRETDNAEYSYLIIPGRFGLTLDRTYFFPLLDKFHNGKANVYLFEYPGFGAREGKPHEKTITEATNEAVEILKQKNLPIRIIGESLGAAVGAQACADFPDDITALLMVAPFDTLAGVAVYHYPFFPIKPLIVEKYDSYQALSKYNKPVYFLLAEKDQTSPCVLGKKLFESYNGPKKNHIVPNAEHDSLDFSPNTKYWLEGLKFISD